MGFGELWSTIPGAQIFDSGYFTHFFLEVTKFSTIRSLAKSHLFPEFCELWSGVVRYHAATCISPSLMHLFCYFLLFFTFVIVC